MGKGWYKYLQQGFTTDSRDNSSLKDKILNTVYTTRTTTLELSTSYKQQRKLYEIHQRFNNKKY